ncbi:MAG: low molecular weight phosphotyrosine protein phosphatase [Propionibacteriaceae bacterium]|jgi:protein-tyrosine phosphatase|nr:low molecular weight phosphotyrosine protein phosphatase [Propionibacteriaceae bacterium]
MAERIAKKKAAEAGMTGVRYTSAATSTDELGNPMDSRAAEELESYGYRSANHRAHQITADEVREADLVVCMEDIHIEKIRRLVPDADNLVLLTDFDPQANPGSGIDDPWYGGASGFTSTRLAIEAAMDGLLDWVRENQS